MPRDTASHMTNNKQPPASSGRDPGFKLDLLTRLSSVHAITSFEYIAPFNSRGKSTVRAYYGVNCRDGFSRRLNAQTGNSLIDYH